MLIQLISKLLELFGRKKKESNRETKKTSVIETKEEPLVKTEPEPELDTKVVEQEKEKSDTEEKTKKMGLDLSAIQQLDFPSNQYYRKEYNKKQIVLHHTASGRGTTGDFRHWLNTPSRIATCVIVDYKGVIYQLFSSKYWGHHIGVKQSFLKANDIDNYKVQNKILNQQSIAIEIDAWGGLKKKDGVWVNYLNKKVDKSRVIEYPQKYRGYHAFERYTDEQIRAVEDLLVFWNERYGIPLRYHKEMWDVSRSALKGHSGIWTHNSYREDKSDCHPQLELKQMLQGLS